MIGKWVYRIIRGLVKLFYPKTEVIGTENLPEEASVIVGNHAQMHGPIGSELYFPEPRYTWCAGEMMQLKEVPSYARRDFWPYKPWWNRWFYHLLSYIIAPISACVFNNAATIGVYHDARIVTTFRTTIKRLEEGANVVIFPERDEPYNNILFQFQDRFIDIARMYYKKTGKELSFVPMYVAPRLHRMLLGEPVPWHHDAPKEAERERICRELQTRITALAEGAPPHRVVIYRNAGRKNYPMNTTRGKTYEESCC